MYRQVILRRISNLPLGIASLGLFCFLLTLGLPSVAVKVFGSPSDFSGVQAIAWAIGIGNESVVNLCLTHTLNVKPLILGVAAYLNVVFLVVPIALKCRISRAIALSWLIVVSLLGLILGLIAPFSLDNTHIRLGYIIWIIGYGLILLSLLAAKMFGYRAP
jgi:hypothetical protein